jgi:hypothetical protein
MPRVWKKRPCSRTNSRVSSRTGKTVPCRVSAGQCLSQNCLLSHRYMYSVTPKKAAVCTAQTSTKKNTSIAQRLVAAPCTHARAVPLPPVR